MNMASVGDLFAFVDVFAGDAVPCVAGWTPATLEWAVSEAGALCAWEAGAGETAICKDKDSLT